MFYLTYLHRELRRRHGPHRPDRSRPRRRRKPRRLVSARFPPVSTGPRARSSTRSPRSAPTSSCPGRSTCPSPVVARARLSSAACPTPRSTRSSTRTSRCSRLTSPSSASPVRASNANFSSPLPSSPSPIRRSRRSPSSTASTRWPVRCRLLAVHQKGKVPVIESTVETGGKTQTVTQNIPPPIAGRVGRDRALHSTKRGRPGLPAGPLQAVVVGVHHAARSHQAGPQPAPDRLGDRALHGRRRRHDPPGPGPHHRRADHRRPLLRRRAPKIEVVLGEGYASRKQLKVGAKLVLDGKDYEVVGLARPPLGGQSADVYLSLNELQRLADRTGRVNTLLVRARQAPPTSPRSPGRSNEPSRARPSRAPRTSPTRSRARSCPPARWPTVSASRSARWRSSRRCSSPCCSRCRSVAKRVRELGTLAALGLVAGPDHSPGARRIVHAGRARRHHRRRPRRARRVRGERRRRSRCTRPRTRRPARSRRASASARCCRTRPSRRSC